MLETILKLLERFVVAHELIAANSVKKVTTIIAPGADKQIKELLVESEEIIDTKPSRTKLKPEDDRDNDEPEEKPKTRKPRQAKPKDEPKGPDLAALREDIKTIAKAIATGDSDECADKFDELLEKFKVRTVTKLKDEQVAEFAAGIGPIYISLLRFEIKEMAAAIKKTDGADELTDLMGEYQVSNVTKLEEDDVESFHASAKKLVGKYYEIEE